MKCFIDFEFIYRAGSPIDPISIGIAREDGMTYYAEYKEADWSKANIWLMQNVQPLLTGELKPKSQIQSEVFDFCSEGGRPDFWGWYCAYDWVLMCELYDGMMNLPQNFPHHCNDLKQYVNYLGNPPLPRQALLGRHHALVDAKWIRKSYYDLKAHASSWDQQVH